jgi:hypothetical protein
MSKRAKALGGEKEMVKIHHTKTGRTYKMCRKKGGGVKRTYT